jgi:hypothetical protein
MDADQTSPASWPMTPRHGVQPFAAASRRHNESKDSPRTGRILAGSQSSEQLPRREAIQLRPLVKQQGAAC